MTVWLGLAAIFLVACVVAGALTGVVSRSRGLAIAAGVIGGGLAALHSLHALVIAIGEYEGERTGYEKLVSEHALELLLVYALGPALVLLACWAAWRLVSGRRAG